MPWLWLSLWLLILILWERRQSRCICFGIFAGESQQSADAVRHEQPQHRHMNYSREMPASHRLRSGRFSMNGQTYLITFCTAQREPLFAQPVRAQLVATKLRDETLWRNSSLLAWVLMPDHCHCLVTLQEETISKLIQRVKAVTARESGIGPPVWMPGFHDHALRTDVSVASAATYIMMNPVRAGLCEHWRVYPHLGSVFEMGS